MGFLNRKSIRAMIAAEVLLFVWLIVGYYLFFSQGCPEYTNEREIIVSNSLLMSDVRLLRAITITTFALLCGPCFLAEYIARRQRLQLPSKLIGSL